MRTRKELTAAIRERSHQASSVDRRILDDLVTVSGYHRKHAIRVLADCPAKPKEIEDAEWTHTGPTAQPAPGPHGARHRSADHQYCRHRLNYDPGMDVDIVDAEFASLYRHRPFSVSFLMADRLHEKGAKGKARSALSLPVVLLNRRCEPPPFRSCSRALMRFFEFAVACVIR